LVRSLENLEPLKYLLIPDGIITLIRFTAVYDFVDFKQRALFFSTIHNNDSLLGPVSCYFALLDAKIPSDIRAIVRPDGNENNKLSHTMREVSSSP